MSVNSKPKTWVGDVAVAIMFCLGILLIGAVVAVAGGNWGGKGSPGRSRERQKTHRAYDDFRYDVKTDYDYTTEKAYDEDFDYARTSE